MIWFNQIMSPRTRSRAAVDDVARYRAELLAHLPEMRAAADRVQRALAHGTAAYEHIRDTLNAGLPISDLKDLIEPDQLRSELSDALGHLERARHRGQCLTFRLLHAEGTSITDIAHTWGISRQLVSRLVNETLGPTSRRVNRRN